MNGILKAIVFITFFLITEVGNAQQQVQYTQYYINPYSLNQAAGGVSNYAEATIASRYQWVGFKDAPKTIYASIFIPYNRKPSSVVSHSKNIKDKWNTLGGYIYSDHTGPTTRNGGYVSFSQNLALSQKVRLSASFTGGIQEFVYSGDNLLIADKNDLTLESNQNQLVPDVNVGLWLYTDLFHLGVSANQIGRNKLEFKGLNNETSSNLERHFFIQAYYKLQMSEVLNLFVTGMTRIVPHTPLPLELGLIFKNEDKFWIGGNYRVRDAIAGIVGMNIIPSIDISYSYGVSLSSITPYNYGNHEIVLTFSKLYPPSLLCPSKFW